MVRIRALAAALAIACLPMLAAAQDAPEPPLTEMGLCRQQLAGTHDTADARERKIAMAMAEQHAAAEARQATLIGWLKAAQAGAKP